MRVKFLQDWTGRFGYAAGQIVAVDGYNPDEIPADVATALEAEGVVEPAPEDQTAPVDG